MSMNRYTKNTEWLVYWGLSLFFIGISFIVITIGARAYQNINIRSTAQFFSQTPLSYISMKIRQNDRLGGIGVGELEGKEALILKEKIEGVVYETWLYVYKGYLREGYILKGDSLHLEDGEKVIPLQAMGVEITYDGIIRFSLETPQGEVKVGQIVRQCMERGEGQ